ncbi:MAG: hypothetical protein P8Y70_21185, partial [Candidatus Lokiarchaeota archaeon]
NKFPLIDEVHEIKLIGSFISLLIFISAGVLIGITKIVSWRLALHREKLRIEKEKVEKSIKDAFSTLDHKFKEWEKKEE